MIWKVAAVVWLIIEVVLSHTPGDRSGEQSEALACWTHLPERALRRGAHVVLFFLLSVLSTLGFGPWAFVFCVVWSVADELTKRGIEGRHCSALDIGLNLIGVVLGTLVWMAV